MLWKKLELRVEHGSQLAGASSRKPCEPLTLKPKPQSLNRAFATPGKLDPKLFLTGI